MESHTFLWARIESRLCWRANCFSWRTVQVSVTTTVSPGVVIFTESCCVNAGIATNSSRTRSNSFIVVLKCAKFTSKFVPIGIICVNLYFFSAVISVWQIYISRFCRSSHRVGVIFRLILHKLCRSGLFGCSEICIRCGHCYLNRPCCGAYRMARLVSRVAWSFVPLLLPDRHNNLMLEIQQPMR